MMAEKSEVVPEKDMLPVHCELLCFMQNKSSVVAFDPMVKICLDFYTRDEVIAARFIIDQYVDSRLTRRQGENMLKTTLEDLLKAVLNPNVKLPVFYAMNMDRLPPVDITNCDVSSILTELQKLRAEVRAAASLQAEIVALKADLASLRSELSEVRKYMSYNTNVSQASNSGVLDTENWPDLSGANSGAASAVPNCTTTEGFLTSYAKQLAENTPVLSASRQSRKPPIIGKSVKSTNIKAVVTKRSINVFCSRGNPHTKSAEIVDCVMTFFKVRIVMT